jgi:hypothetical protein
MILNFILPFSFFSNEKKKKKSLYERESKKEKFSRVFSFNVGEHIPVPGLRDFFLFTDPKSGALCLLNYVNDPKANQDNFMKNVFLGTLTDASCLTYLGEKKLFIGERIKIC